MLSVLEYTARMYGVSLVRDTVVWGTCAGMPLYPSPERPQLGDREQWSRGGGLCGWPQGVHAGPGLRITTDLDGNILGTARYLPDADPAQVTPQ